MPFARIHFYAGHRRSVILNDGNKKSRGFTLIELLVVISVAALLIAILLPALDMARESGMKAKCLINLKQLATANTAFAIDNDNESVPGSDDGMGTGVYAIWRDNPRKSWSGGYKNGEFFERFGMYRRMGVLVNEDYTDTPVSMYCPSVTENHDWLRPGGVMPNRPSHSAWFYDAERPDSVRIMSMSYHYRETFSGVDYARGDGVAGQRFDNVLNIGIHPSDMVLIADAFSDPFRGIADAHVDGYNFARLDGSGAFYLDTKNEIENFNNGHGYFGDTRKIERGFETFRWGDVVDQSTLAP